MGIQENYGNDRGMELSDVPLGTKNKYTRMDSELTDFDDDFNDALRHHRQTEERRKITRRFVFACAIFASFNNVLLGYGESLFFIALFFFVSSWFFWRKYQFLLQFVWPFLFDSYMVMGFCFWPYSAGSLTFFFIFMFKSYPFILLFLDFL